MIKVMHVLNSNQYSGAENVAIEIINNTRDCCESVYVSPYGKIADYLSKDGIQYISIEKLSRKTLMNAIKIFQPDIIHAHGFRAGIFAFFTGTSIPIINHLHNNCPWIKKISFKTVLYACCCFRFNKILTVSSSVMSEFVFGKNFIKKTEMVGNPFYAKRIKKMVKEAELKHSSDIIWLGRIVTSKRPFFFLDILLKVKQTIPDINVVVVGDGDLRTEFVEKIRDMNLQNNVTVYGFLENPYGLLDNAKVMCMPSSWEGFGLAAVEALTLGTPVVCSGEGGLSNIVNDVNGKICGSDVNSYSEEIIKLLTNKKYLDNKSQKAFESSLKFDNLEIYKQKIIRIYKEISR